MTDMRVETAVSVAVTASCKMEEEHDSMEVMENPIGLYFGLIEWSASFSRLILLKMLSTVRTLLPLPLPLQLTLEEDWDPWTIEKEWTEEKIKIKISIIQKIKNSSKT